MTQDGTQIDSAEPVAVELGALLQSAGFTITTAESCTGGLIAATITDVPGSSAWFERAWICYTNQAKVELLGIPERLLGQHGAVSASVVCAMAEGAKLRASADIAIAVSGIAGPSGGSMEKPVGTVWLAWCVGDLPTETQHFVFSGSRRAVRAAATKQALHGTIRRVQSALGESHES